MCFSTLYPHSCHSTFLAQALTKSFGFMVLWKEVCLLSMRVQLLFTASLEWSLSAVTVEKLSYDTHYVHMIKQTCIHTRRVCTRWSWSPLVILVVLSVIIYHNLSSHEQNMSLRPSYFFLESCIFKYNISSQCSWVSLLLAVFCLTSPSLAQICIVLPSSFSSSLILNMATGDVSTTSLHCCLVNLPENK